jgi:hypothetical protein
MIDRLESTRAELAEMIEDGDRALSSFALSHLASALASVDLALGDASIMEHARAGAVGPRRDFTR